MEQTSDSPVSAGEAEAFKAEVSARIAVEQDVLRTVTKPRKWRMLGYGVAAALLFLCALFIIIRPDGFLLWVMCSYILISLAWLILFLPTSKREPGFIKQRRAFRKKGMKGTIKTLAKRRKRLFAEVWIDSFLYGNVLPTISVSVIFTISIACCIYYSYMVKEVPTDLGTIIIVQGFALILLRVLLIMFKPYARGTLNVPGAFKGRVSTARTRGKLALSIALIVVILAIAVTGFVLVMAFILPGATRDRIWDYLMADGGTNLLTVVILFIVMYVIWRHLQSIMGTILAMDVSAAREKRLREQVAEPLDKAMSQAGGMRRQEFDELRLRYYRVAIYKYVKHDIFGLAPIYLIAPDIKYLLDDQALELLATAGGLGG